MRAFVAATGMFAVALVGCAHQSFNARVQYDTVRIARRDTVVLSQHDTTFVVRADTVRIPVSPTGVPSNPSERNRLIAERDAARAQASNAGHTAAQYQQMLTKLDPQFMSAISKPSDIKNLRRDSVRIDGYREMTEGEVYNFALTIAKQVDVPIFSARVGTPLETDAIPAIKDSVRACIHGLDFTIDNASKPGEEVCVVKIFPDTAIRVWKWSVVPSPVDSREATGKVERTLTFKLTSYVNGMEADPEIVYPVVVRVRPLGLAEQVKRGLTTTEGLLVAATGVVTALLAFFAATRIGKNSASNTHAPG